jgi:choline dehydrogenase
MTTAARFDYIVIGAGSAGCVVASRLSEDKSVNVLLLEAGPAAGGFWMRTPAGMAMLFHSERVNWGYQTEPVAALNDRRIFWPRGKVLGGTSAINGMVFIRGDRRDFDGWAGLGNSGWSWNDVLPYFKRMESNVRGGNASRGGEGPLVVSDPREKHPAVADFIAAARAMGSPAVEDFNAGDVEGAGFFQASIRHGARHSAYDAFIAPVRGRGNLTVRTNVHVRRVLIEDGVAAGVELVAAGATHTLRAAREVIVSAGALNSPQLLMLSGVGEGAALQAHGIRTLADLPGVGKNLQDHFTVRMQFATTPASSVNRDFRGWRKYAQGAKYLASGGGWLAMPSSWGAAFLRSSPDIPYADVEVAVRPYTYKAPPGGSVTVDKHPAFGVSVYRVRPASRGEVRLRSADPFEAPAFLPNFLGHPEDIAATISAGRQVRGIFASDPMARRVLGELVPGGGVRTDDQWLDFMRREGQCAFHPAGSCKMGSDAMAVVDARLRVRGVQRLRVIDASIMPVVVSGNTNAASMMIGEKGADMIREDQRELAPLAA